MRAVRFLLAAVLCVAACGVRTPPAIDVTALVRERGEVDARRELTARVLADPRDVQARLALAAVADQAGRPSEAIEQLEAVVRLGGPLGTRWRAADRARLGRLLLARGRARVARGAATALADLERARSLGAVATAHELERARIAIAIAQIRHVDAKQRAQGRGTLAAHASATARDASAADATNPRAAWRGAKPGAPAGERGAFGLWLWRIGARREAYDQLAAWRAATKPPRDAALHGAYLRALAWWSPVWLGQAEPPPADELVGPARCWFPGTACAPPADEDSEPMPAPPLDASPRVRAAVRYAATRLDVEEILRRVAPAVRVEVAATVDPALLVPIARAFERDPAIAERRGRDFVARAADAAFAHAVLGALFDALGDPARARAAWHAAVDASPEPLFVRGLAEATARTGDAPAALVFATQASAAWGDPAVVWASVAATLVAAGQPVEALTAARYAIDLAGPEVLPRALELASEASRALGRTQQADALAAQRAGLDQIASRTAADAADTGELRAALTEHREQPTAATVARLWVAAQAHPRDVEARAALLASLDADDPRRASVVDELVTLAGDRDPVRAYAAAAALRR